MSLISLCRCQVRKYFLHSGAHILANLVNWYSVSILNPHFCSVLVKFWDFLIAFRVHFIHWQSAAVHQTHWMGHQVCNLPCGSHLGKAYRNWWYLLNFESCTETWNNWKAGKTQQTQFWETYLESNVGSSWHQWHLRYHWYQLFYGDHLQDFCSASEGPQIEIQFCAQNIWPKSAAYLQAHPQSHNYPLMLLTLLKQLLYVFQTQSFLRNQMRSQLHSCSLHMHKVVKELDRERHHGQRKLTIWGTRVPGCETLFWQHPKEVCRKDFSKIQTFISSSGWLWITMFKEKKKERPNFTNVWALLIQSTYFIAQNLPDCYTSEVWEPDMIWTFACEGAYHPQFLGTTNQHYNPCTASWH